MSSKILEAQEHEKRAEQSMKTSFFKWFPDYDSAADEYNKAATCYRVAKSTDKAKECLLKASDCYNGCKSLYHAAKCLDQYILLCKESGTAEEIQRFAKKACSLYQQHGSLDSGASVLSKAAKMLEHNNPQLALQLFQQAVDVIMIEDGTRQAIEFINKAARIMVKLQMYDEAADAIQQEIGYQQANQAFQAIGRLTVALVLVQLARGDSVAAEKAFKTNGNYCEVSEAQTLEALLQAYEDQDADSARNALNSPFIRHMDVEYAQLALTVPLPREMVNPNVPKEDSNQESGVAEDEDGLC